MYVNYLHRNKMNKERPKIRCKNEKRWKNKLSNVSFINFNFFFSKSFFKERNKHRKNMKSEMGTTNCMSAKRPVTITLSNIPELVHILSFIFIRLIFYLKRYFFKEFLDSSCEQTLRWHSCRETVRSIQKMSSSIPVKFCFVMFL